MRKELTAAAKKFFQGFRYEIKIVDHKENVVWIKTQLSFFFSFNANSQVWRTISWKVDEASTNVECAILELGASSSFTMHAPNKATDAVF